VVAAGLTGERQAGDGAFVVLLTGPPGAGKSEVAGALHDSLAAEGTAAAVIELDELARSHPPLDRSRSIAHLGLLSASFREAGHELLIVTATIEDRVDAEAVLAAAGARAQLLVRLEAEPRTLRARLEAREPEGWSGLGELVRSSERLAETMTALPGVDLVLHTESKRADQVAAELKAALDRALPG
jgi:predicted kinase